MDRKINLDFRFRKSNKEISGFSQNFFDDLNRCLNRFKISIAKSENDSAKTGNYTLIFLSVNDLDDKQFISDIIPLADKQGVILICVDPVKNVDKGFPIHKFKIYKFWDEINETSEIRFFRRNLSETNAYYWELITDIAIDIDERNSPVRTGKKGKVYLAQTDDSQSTDRDNIIRDLIEMGYEVFPDRLLSLNYKECTEQITGLMKDCKLIIHPIPLVYSKHFADKQVSLVEQQCNLSAQFVSDKQNSVKRIIWIPSDFEITDEENQIFVEKIQRDQDQSSNTMVLKVALEELKKIYSKILAGEELDSRDTNLPDVYLIADIDDEKTGESLIGGNSTKGMAISKNFKGITYNQHLKYLANSQCVIINYTSDNEPWFTMKVNDIFKSKGINASKPFKKLILVKENKELNTSDFENRFSEVHISSMDNVKLDLAVKNNK